MSPDTIMVKCVKCETGIQAGEPSCSRCTWPFSVEGWSATSFKIRRVTLDTGCINAKGLNSSLATLERWASQGLFELQRSDAMLEEISGARRVTKAKAMAPHPGLFILGSSILNGPDVLAGPDLETELQELLFPTAHPMTKNQMFDVEHLRLHVRRGSDVFVTLNRNDYITRGRQEKLRSWGIWVMEPQETVDLLGSLYGWSTE